MVRQEFNMDLADTLNDAETVYLTFPRNLELPYDYHWTINVDTISGSHSGSTIILQRSDFVNADIWENMDTVSVTGPGNYTFSGADFSGFRQRAKFTTGGTHSSVYRGAAVFKAPTD